MNFPALDKNYWNERWTRGETSWDIGYPSPAIVKFVNGIANKQARILIPGAGNAYEAEYLHSQGFTHVFVVDLAEDALAKFAARVPEFPKSHLLCTDFFLLEGKFDLVIEQTFFCAIDPVLRAKYVSKMYELLADKGVLAGLLFNDPLNTDKPPFGGNADEYRALFAGHFSFRKFEMCADSIGPRQGRELWIELVKK